MNNPNLKTETAVRASYRDQFAMEAFQTYIQCQSMLFELHLENQILLRHFIDCHSSSRDPQTKQSSQSGSDQSNKNQKSNSTNHNGNSQSTTNNKSTSNRDTIKSRERPHQQSEASDYQPEYENSSESQQFPLSETKNVPKNFGKSILNFILSNLETTQRVLALLKIDKGAFLTNANSLRGRVTTIAQLRSLWLDESNHFAKAYRVLTGVYLRKHSLTHIFNSRVKNLRRHIKYRQKIIDAVQKPTEFTFMKDF